MAKRKKPEDPTPPRTGGNFLTLDLTGLPDLIMQKLAESEQDQVPPGKPALKVIKGGKA